MQCYWGSTDIEGSTIDPIPNRPALPRPITNTKDLKANPPAMENGNTIAKAEANRRGIRVNSYISFGFLLTKNQPASFWAGDLTNLSNGTHFWTGGLDKLVTTVNAPQFKGFGKVSDTSATPPVNAGELKCWATNSAGNKEIHHNHLSGKATVVSFSPEGTPTSGVNTNTGDVAQYQAHEYNAWAFQAHYQDKYKKYPTNSVHYTGQALPTPGSLKFDGVEYDQCPSILVGQFTPAQHPTSFLAAVTDTSGPGILNPGDVGPLGTGRGNRVQVSYANCHEDMREAGQSHITKIDYSVWNANERKQGGGTIHECIGAWHESDLGATFPAFRYRTLQTDTAYFRATPKANAQCNQDNRGGTVVTATGAVVVPGKMDSDIEQSSFVGIQINDVGGEFQTSANLVGWGGKASYSGIAPGKGEILYEIDNSFGKK